MSEPVAPSPSPSSSSESSVMPPAQSAASSFAWILLAVSVTGLAGLGYYTHKTTKNAANLGRQLSAAQSQSKLVSKELGEAKSRLAELDGEKQRLSGELRETAAQKEAAQAELERTRAELANKLAGEIKNGEVVLRLREGDLIVDVADKVLFDTGKAEVSERGQKVLRQVSASIIHMPKRVFQISGHTDAARVKSADVKEHFPTNWELSTARATNVVRFLQEKCGIPGRRLVAAGYAEHQPIASNATEKGKQRNRRIEIALLKEVPAE
jgi:chemotaxis protein MotB